MPLPVNRSLVGLALESVKGTGLVATDYIPLTKFDPDDKYTMLEDLGWRGSMVKQYGEVQGVVQADIDLGGAVFPDTFGYPLAGILGDVAVTGAGPYTHAMAVKNTTDGQPKAITWTDSNPVQPRLWQGCQMTDLSLKYDAGGLLTWDGKCSGFISATATAPTPSFSATTPLPVWAAAATIGGSSLLTVASADIDLKRTVEVIQTADGNQLPYAVFVGELEVDIKMTVVAENETQLANYLSNAQPSVDLFLSSGANSLRLHFTKAAYTEAKLSRGKAYFAYDITAKAVANTTDAGGTGGYSPVKATVISTKPTGTYQ